jgi:hypothetical protein
MHPSFRREIRSQEAMLILTLRRNYDRVRRRYFPQYCHLLIDV